MLRISERLSLFRICQKCVGLIMQGAKRLKSQDGCRKWHQLAFHVRSLIILWIDFPVLLLPRYHAHPMGQIPSCRFYRANSIMRIPSYRGNSVMQIPLWKLHHANSIVRIPLCNIPRVHRAYSIVRILSCVFCHAGFHHAVSILQIPLCVIHRVHSIVCISSFYRVHSIVR